MEKADLPTGPAREPSEGARQPVISNTMSPPFGQKQKKNGITFAEDTQSSEISSSQCNSSYKDILSQPGPGLSHRQRMLWIQKRRGPGLWVQCDECDKWRFLAHVVDRHELPDKWYCRMNTDRSVGDCSVDETQIHLRDEEDLIHSEYSAGSVVWARLAGWGWWPGVVADCPDTEQFYWLDGFSDIPTHYNVAFFDSGEVTRAWITPEHLKPYAANKKTLKHVAKNKKYKKRLEAAFKQADDADKLPLAERLAKYSFVARYKGHIGSPKKFSKVELTKYKNKLKRRLDIDFSDDNESDSDGSPSRTKSATKSDQRRREMRNKNTILVGTPKRMKRANSYKNITDEPKESPIKSPNKNGRTATVIEPAEGVFKQPDSMNVQIGSTSINNTLAIDNDSSKTYLPENEIAHTEDSSGPIEIHTRIATPSSDDFEF